MGLLAGNPYFVSWDELFGPRQGTTWTATGERNYTRQFRVIARVKEIDPLAVCLCPGLPLPNSFYVTATSFDLLALVTSIEAKQENQDDWQNWIVDYKYSTRPPPGGFPTINQQPGNQNNPETEPPDIEWDSDVVQVSPRWDLDGNRYKNRADQPFKPSVSFPVGHTVLSITRNELGFNAYLAAKYNFAVNSDVFLGTPPGCIQCQPPRAKMMFRGTTRYWKVSYRLKFGYIIEKDEKVNIITPDGENITDEDSDFKQDPTTGLPVGLRKFQPLLLNHGTMARKVPDGPPSREPCFEQGTVRDRNLDADGMIRLFDLSPYFIRFRQYRRMPFASLIVNGLA